MHSKYITKPCAFCANPFTVTWKERRQRFCSHRCSTDANRRPVADKFWEKVRKTGGCWYWTAAVTNTYGTFTLNARNCQAHRFSWQLHFGNIPKGTRVLHRCDNRLCVRPDHLFLGSAADNSADMVSKERQARGERVVSAKLTADDVRAIRAAEGPYTHIAKQFGVSPAAVCLIRTRKTWKHIP